MCENREKIKIFTKYLPHKDRKLQLSEKTNARGNSYLTSKGI